MNLNLALNILRAADLRQDLWYLSDLLLLQAGAALLCVGACASWLCHLLGDVKAKEVFWDREPAQMSSVRAQTVTKWSCEEYSSIFVTRQESSI